jgi:hypothetical protein
MSGTEFEDLSVTVQGSSFVGINENDIIVGYNQHLAICMINLGRDGEREYPDYRPGMEPRDNHGRRQGRGITGAGVTNKAVHGYMLVRGS